MGYSRSVKIPIPDPKLPKRCSLRFGSIWRNIYNKFQRGIDVDITI